MKKILILCLSLCAIALIPQTVSAQTQPKPKPTKKEVLSKAKGDVVPMRTAEEHKAQKAKTVVKTNGKQMATQPVVKEANKVEKEDKKKVKEPVRMRIRPLKGAEKAPKKVAPVKITKQ